jgi:hypothetical protein
VTSRLDEVDTGVDTVVDNVHAVDLVLGIQVSIEALLDVLNDWAPGVVVVDKVTETRSVNDSQAQANAVLLDVGADGLDVDGLGCEVERRLLALLRGVERGVEEGVDQSGLSEARLTWKLNVSSEYPSTLYVTFYSPTTITLKLKPLRTLLRCHWLGRLAKPT